MPLLEHFRELRNRAVKTALVIIAGAVVGWAFYNQIITKLAEPVCDLRAAQASGATSCGSLYINGVLGPLNLQIKVAILSGVILTAPLWLYQLWAFIAPALHRREKEKFRLLLHRCNTFLRSRCIFRLYDLAGCSQSAIWLHTGSSLKLG